MDADFDHNGPCHICHSEIMPHDGLIIYHSEIMPHDGLIIYHSKMSQNGTWSLTLYGYANYHKDPRYIKNILMGYNHAINDLFLSLLVSLRKKVTVFKIIICDWIYWQISRLGCNNLDNSFEHIHKKGRQRDNSCLGKWYVKYRCYLESTGAGLWAHAQPSLVNSMLNLRDMPSIRQDLLCCRLLSSFAPSASIPPAPLTMVQWSH